VNPLTLGVDAMMYEPVLNGRGRRTYLHGAPRELHLLNHPLRREQIVLYGAVADMDRCSRGHQLLKGGYEFVMCDLCDQWLCQYCANLKFGDKVGESDLWHCVWCRLGLVAETPADDEEQPQGNTRSTTFNDHLQQLAVRSREAVCAQLVAADGVRLAPRAALVAHLRALQVTHSGSATDAQLRTLVRATLTGGVATFPRLDEAGERAVGETAGAWWAAEWECTRRAAIGRPVLRRARRQARHPVCGAPGELRYRIGFSCAEHMEAFLMLLCNGDLDILSELPYPGTSRGDRRGRKRLLSPMDEALLYFELERRGTPFVRLAVEFGVSERTVSSVVASFPLSWHHAVS
jgi:hypothetical protein